MDKYGNQAEPNFAVKHFSDFLELQRNPAMPQLHTSHYKPKSNNAFLMNINKHGYPELQLHTVF